VATSNNRLRVLLVEDSRDDAGLVELELRRAGIEPMLHRVDCAADMVEALRQGTWDVVLSGFFLARFSGKQALELLRANSADIPFIVVSGSIGEEQAVALLQAGAQDCVMKDRLARLVPVVERSLIEARFRQESRSSQIALFESEARFKAIVSNMPGMAFELEVTPDGNLSFISISDGCHALFHVAPDLLLQDPRAFVDRVLIDDVSSFNKSLQDAFRQRGNWNWEGRIRVSGSGEIKWVNLRSRSRVREDSRICWDGIIFNITQNRLADLEIRRAHENLARLSAHVEAVKEQERSHIAREIHDELGGTLTAIKIMLVRLGQELATGTTVTPKAKQRLQETEELLESTMKITRRIATSLRPAILDLGIVAAIEWQASEFQKRMDMDCRVTCASKEIELDNKVSVVLFRTFQEALTNIAKHAGATRVEVELEADADSVTLQVHDNGRGIAKEDMAKSQAYGILGMRERARNLGGEAGVRRTRSGTAVLVRVPRVAPEDLTSLEET
jgi:signal transduction histidine kinase